MGDNGSKVTTTIKNYSLYFSVLAIELVVLVPCIVITISELVKYNAELYEQENPDFSKIVRYHFLTPLLACQAIWMLTNILSVLAVHMTIPYLFIPNIIFVIIGFVLCMVIIAPSVEFILETKVPWPIVTFFVGMVVFVILLLAFIIVRIATFRKLVKKKKAVQVTVEKPPTVLPEAPPATPTPPSVAEVDEISTSFSRRSTMSIGDDRFELPPKM